jgi:hypothetical protein
MIRNDSVKISPILMGPTQFWYLNFTYMYILLFPLLCIYTEYNFLRLTLALFARAVISSTILSRDYIRVIKCF